MSKFGGDEDSKGYTGKRKKSYREIDAARGRTKNASRHDDPSQQRIERSASYEKYKKAADAIFEGGELPETLAATFDPAGKRTELRSALKLIADAKDRKTWAALVTQFLTEHELPEDAFFLDSILDHPKDAVVERALARLEELCSSGKLQQGRAPRSLLERLQTLAMMSMEPTIQERAKVLRGKLV